MAMHLHIEVSTVKTHLYHIYHKIFRLRLHMVYSYCSFHNRVILIKSNRIHPHSVVEREVSGMFV